MGLLDFLKPNVNKMKEREDIKGLIKALRHEDRGVRQEAMPVLEEIGDRGFIIPFIHNLIHIEYTVRVKEREAARTFLDIDAMLRYTKNIRDESEVDREKPLRALEMIGNSRTVEPFVQALRKNVQTLKGKDIKVLLTDEEKELLSLPHWALKKIGVPAVEPLIKVMMDKSEDSKLRRDAAEDFGRWLKDARAVEPLTQLLKDEDEFVRKKAKKALEDIARYT